MIVPLNFEGPEQFVWDTDLAELPTRVQAAWAAFCVGTVGPLLPPSFHDRFPFARCVQTAWDFALNRPFDRDETARLSLELQEYGEVLGQTERPPKLDNPGWWLSLEGYQLAHLLAPALLLEAVLRPEWLDTDIEWLANNAMTAVENAGLVYKDYQYWRQGFAVTADSARFYAEFVTTTFYAMSRRAYEVARAHVGEPTETMFAGVEFPHDCEPLAPELVAASISEMGPAPAHHEKWLRETGRWRGAA